MFHVDVFCFHFKVVHFCVTSSSVDLSFRTDVALQKLMSMHVSLQKNGSNTFPVVLRFSAFCCCTSEIISFHNFFFGIFLTGNFRERCHFLVVN